MGLRKTPSIIQYCGFAEGGPARNTKPMARPRQRECRQVIITG